MRISELFAGLLMISFTTAGWAAEPYQLIKPAQPTHSGDKIEVVEVFWYGCPHCYSLEPYLEDWLKNKPDDVAFRRVPGILGKNWIAHARAYFTAEKLGIVDKIHRPLFDAIHRDRKNIMSESALRDFFAQQGVDKKQFDDIYQSDEVSDMVKSAFSEGQAFGLTGVPAIVVNGKYLTSASQAGGNKELISVIGQLTEQERSAQAAAE